MITQPNNTGPLSSQEELGFRGTREVHQFFSAETEKMGGGKQMRRLLQIQPECVIMFFNWDGISQCRAYG